jgi:hypothetical protein
MGKQVEQPQKAEAYEAPELRVLGSVQELTFAAAAGASLDQDFPVGTPSTDLLFS